MPLHIIQKKDLINMKLKTYYTKNICNEYYNSIVLICKAKNILKAIRIFREYINSSYFLKKNTDIFIYDQIKVLENNKVMEISYLE